MACLRGESAELASALIEGPCAELGIDPGGLVLHVDNGGPMKGATMAFTISTTPTSSVGYLTEHSLSSLHH